jgi:hypothetical protein
MKNICAFKNVNRKYNRDGELVPDMHMSGNITMKSPHIINV